MNASPQREIHLPLDETLYSALEDIALQEQISIPQTARLLLEIGLRQRMGKWDEITTREIEVLAQFGGGFDWLVDEPDLYNDSCGEAL